MLTQTLGREVQLQTGLFTMMRAMVLTLSRPDRHRLLRHLPLRLFRRARNDTSRTASKSLINVSSFSGRNDYADNALCGCFVD